MPTRLGTPAQEHLHPEAVGTGQGSAHCGEQHAGRLLLRCLHSLECLHLEASDSLRSLKIENKVSDVFGGWGREEPFIIKYNSILVKH